MMQAVLSQVSNPDNAAFLATRILFDSGSKLTYIAKELAKELQMKEISRVTVTTYTCRYKKPKNCLPIVVKLALQKHIGELLMA